MDLYERLKTIHSQIDKIWLFYYENILGHRPLLLERASHPWLGTRPIVNKGTCPGFCIDVS